MTIARFVTIVCLAVIFSLPAPVARSADYELYSTRGGFADVRQDLEDAIINRGYVIDFKGAIGTMLARTRNDVGSSKKLYKNAEFLIFCSAKLSRATMEADPHNIAFCPYAMVVYELSKSPGTIYVSHRNLKSSGSKQLAVIHDVLRAMDLEATK